jgi:hypothetical protein
MQFHVPFSVRHVFTALALTWTASAGSAQAATRWATLEAIHRLENPRNVARPGPRGELGAYQFRIATWRMHTKAPFQQALDRETSDHVAVEHYEWLKHQLELAGREASTFNIALAWNGGLSGVLSGTAPKVARDYARRAVNIADALEATARANATPRVATAL